MNSRRSRQVMTASIRRTSDQQAGSSQIETWCRLSLVKGFAGPSRPPLAQPHPGEMGTFPEVTVLIHPRDRASADIQGATAFPVARSGLREMELHPVEQRVVGDGARVGSPLAEGFQVLFT